MSDYRANVVPRFGAFLAHGRAPKRKKLRKGAKCVTQNPLKNQEIFNVTQIYETKTIQFVISRSPVQVRPVAPASEIPPHGSKKAVAQKAAAFFRLCSGSPPSPHATRSAGLVWGPLLPGFHLKPGSACFPMGLKTAEKRRKMERRTQFRVSLPRKRSLQRPGPAGGLLDSHRLCLPRRGRKKTLSSSLRYETPCCASDFPPRCYKSCQHSKILI